MSSILLFGDLILDIYYYGSSTRIANEGPFPVVNISEIKKQMGCIGNVLQNILFFFDNIYLITCINTNDVYEVKSLIKDYKNVKLANYHQENRPIIKKTRIYSDSICTCRFDEEQINDIDSTNQIKIFEYIKSIISKIDIVLLSDYNKGTLTKQLTLNILELTKTYNIISLIEPKTNDFSKYKNATIVKPNKIEFQDCLSYEKIKTIDDLSIIQNMLIDKYNINII